MAYTFFQRKSEYPKYFYIIDVYHYIMVKSLIIWGNGINLLTHTLHWLIVCHSVNCEVHLISSWKQKVYCKNTAKSFWLIFNSKLFAVVAKFSVLIPAGLVLLDFLKKWLSFQYFKRRPLLYITCDILFGIWLCGVPQKCVFNSFHKLCITLFGNGIFECITT